MPGGNGTGPAGQGPMTGRGAGFCSGADIPGYAGPVTGQSRTAPGKQRRRRIFSPDDTSSGRLHLAFRRRSGRSR